ncbi:MarR family transcriptional regulator [Hymenobacter lutimineralis]|uniref:MarR family transcriptional regulator n=1 Tax=Hymenobacter lutimineralis TaxID=2606448 RepID=A0A5D6V6J1_9BACT|nr:helix-turn-helix domain-containing protein [Hymenobacter lutimineralis]TYZ10930.1 MarR family transcriptional regulator [Hymenobacter lutimineralis]
MTDAEFDLLDELYFVSSFNDLAQRTALPPAELDKQLRNLLEQGLVRLYWPDADTELAFEPSSFGAISRDSFYLASKEGLLQHNTQ